MNIDLKDLIVAYKKAKVDMYYTQPYGSRFDIVDYEENLVDRLKYLKKKLKTNPDDLLKDDDFLGDWILIPKSFDQSGKPHPEHIISSNPNDEWEQMAGKSKVGAEFRVMAWASMDFHVLSSLWMQKVGFRFDAMLSDDAYGNRMRLKKDKSYNNLSLGSFKQYYIPYNQWRRKAIKSMRQAIDDGKKIVAITADATSFYHKIDADFMDNDDFLTIVCDKFRDELNSDEAVLHALFIKALKAWADKTPLRKGLPVGLPASSVVANMALWEFDKIILQEITPIYYGRYVDDIILVMENGSDFKTNSEVWEWIEKRFDGKLIIEPKYENKVDPAVPSYSENKDGNKDGSAKYIDSKSQNEDKTVSFKPLYLENSEIIFKNDKNKMFLLAGEHGRNLVNSIESNIHKLSSEWPAMPRIPRSDAGIEAKLVKAARKDGEAADNLRKTDTCTMCRVEFAIMLRDFEAYERHLSSNVWRVQRHAFLKAYTLQIQTPHTFFDLLKYLPRIVRLATACEDFELLYQMIDKVNKTCHNIKKYCELKINSVDHDDNDQEEIRSRWETYLFESIAESIVAAFSYPSSQGKTEWEQFIRDIEKNHDSIFEGKFSDIQDKHTSLFVHDLAHRPFRSIYLLETLRSDLFQDKYHQDIKGYFAERKQQISNLLNFLEQYSSKNWFSGIGSLFDLMWGNKQEREENKATEDEVRYETLLGFSFPIRPFNFAELYILAKNVGSLADNKRFEEIVLAQRGFKPEGQLPEQTPVNKHDRKLYVSYGNFSSKSSRTLVVASWETAQESWQASVSKNQDPNQYDRLCRLTRMIDAVISNNGRVDYLIMPELAIPASWFLHLAIKLQRCGISLITGVEYLHRPYGKVANQVWASLLNDSLGFPSFVVYKQDKQRPALSECVDLKRVADIELTPCNKWKRPPIIQHGDFYLGVLICSELTNIEYRSSLRGKVDAVFIPEWNQDCETFNALVESSALDIHAYIVQCNNRLHGDSRIRAPYKEAWQRDLMRVKGGIYDYFVTCKIDIHQLRQFQSGFQSPEKPFKPVPDGFEISKERKMLPS